MPKKKIDYSKVEKRQINRTEKQNAAAIANLKKARQTRQAFAALRREGVTRDTIEYASEKIDEMLDQFANYSPENNPAVAKLLSEVGYLRTPSQLAELKQSEYVTYVTALRDFLNNPLSSTEGIEEYRNKILSQIIGDNLMRRKGERRSNYYKRRQNFIEDNEETAKAAFKIYRMLEETHAGQILRGKISPAAYGSDNLITDLFDFVESGAFNDGDFNKARAYWADILEKSYAEDQEILRQYGSKAQLPKFYWRGVDSYASFTPKPYYAKKSGKKRR